MNSKHTAVSRGRNRGALLIFFAIAFGMLLAVRGMAQDGRPPVRLRGHVPSARFVQRELGAVDPRESLDLSLALPLRNQAALAGLMERLYDPSDPQYGKFLTPEEFTERFAPTESDYAAVERFANAAGLKITGTHPNRLLLNVRGNAATVERAFSTRLAHYQARNGRVFRAPAIEPGVPASLTGVISGVAGLDNLAVRRPSVTASPGTGPGGGHTPLDVKTAYNLTTVTQDGTGQVLGLLQLDGYKSSDIAGYESAFGLPNVTLQNVLVDGVNGAAGSGSDEVTLDIELQIALAPGASKIMVYEGPNTDQGFLDILNRMANDNTAKSMSTSWGAPESQESSSVLNAESSIFIQMAAQGQSFFSASGDNGAYDDGTNLGVDDPASQPYVTGVGGTTLATVSAGGAYSGESTWNGGSKTAGGGGGGISGFWSIPSYQTGLGTAANNGSATKRMVPDISLDADPKSGYSVYYNAKWWVYGGTSCAAPLWSAFTALVNQARVSQGRSTIGLLNPTLTTIGKGSRAATDFHDVSDGTTNLFYPATTGYDLATGWGTINGANLLTDLVNAGATTYTVSGSVTLNGAGLAGVTLTAGTVTATTATDGSYTLSNLASGTYTVTPSLSGYTFAPASSSVTVNANVTAVNFTATATVPTYSILGTITSGGTGLSGVTVSAGGKTATTSSTGAYSISGLQAGSYTVSPSLTNYSFSPTSKSVTIGSANVTGVDFTATLITYTVKGTITYQGNGLSGVTVTAGPYTANTDGTGAYTLTVTAGTYTVTPSRANFKFTPASRSVNVAADVTGIDFTATQVFSISGTVTVNGVGLAGVSVAAGNSSTTTNAGGAYVLSNLAAGSYTVTPNKAGYTFTPDSQPVNLNANTNVNFAAAVATYSISGTITAGAVGLSGVTVSAGNSSATTASDGTYTITGLATAVYTVTPQLSGYIFSPSSRSVSVGSNVAGINFTASLALYSMSGFVTLKGGGGVAGVKVSNGSTTVTTGANGTFTFNNLTPGSYTVSPALDGYTFSPTSQSVAVNANVSGVAFTATQVPTLMSVTVKRSPLKAKLSTSGTIQFSIPVTATTIVTLSSSNTAALTVPASVKLAKNKSSASFSVKSKKVAAQVVVTITARSGGATRTTQVTVTP